MNEPAIKPGPTDQERIDRGKTVTVFYEEKFDGKTSETVMIHMIRNRDSLAPDLMDPVMNRHAFVAFVCRKNREWAESIDTESALMIVDETRRMCPGFFDSLARIEAEARKRIESMSEAQIERALAVGKQAEAAQTSHIGALGRRR